MRRSKSIIVLAIIVLIMGILGGCTVYPARKVVPDTTTYPDNVTTPNLPNQPGIPENVVGRDNANEMISATYEMVDFSDLTISSNCKAKSGAGNNYATVGSLQAGEKVRALGKLDGWYLVKMPGSNRIAAVPANNAQPASYNTPTGKNVGTTARTPAKTTAPGAAGTTGTTKAGTQTATGSAAMTSDESRILQLCNAERAKVGAKPLKANGDCTKLARMKSQDMVSKNYFSHQSPTYGSPFDMLKKYGVGYMYAGENIAMNQSADRAFKAWMNSEGHRKNILNPNFTELGIGIVSKGNGSNIYTQLFIGR